MAVIKHVQHIRSNELSGTNPKSPTSGDVHYGEIAINYHSGTETIFLRNDEDEIVTFKPGGLVGVANTDSALTVSTSNGEATIGSALWSLSSTSGVAAKYAYANTATGAGSFAVGTGTSATGAYSVAEGRLTRASGSSSHAEGYQTKAVGNYSHAEGASTSAKSSYSHAEGYASSAADSYTHAEGQQTYASQLAAHAEGSATSATGQYSHSEGLQTRASGSCAHAEGSASKAIANRSHAEGESTSASGFDSHAEGCRTIAQGPYSHAGGSGSTAGTTGAGTSGNGAASFAHGLGVIVEYDNETAFGQYNYRSTGTDASAKTFFSIGIGTSSSAKKSAVDVRSNGDIYINTGNTATGTAVLLQNILTTWDCGDYA